jgi:hypothetical protein
MKGLDLYNAMAKAHAWDNGGASPEAPMNQYIINNNWKLATVNVSNLQQPTGAVKDDEDSDDLFNRAVNPNMDYAMTSADLNKPIIVHKDGRTVLDGNHRVAKARKTGTTSLPAYIPESKMDLTLVNQEISEARLYRTTNGFKNLTGRDIANLLYLHTLSLYMMLQDDSSEDYAVAYAKQTSQYGYFSLMRTHGTDIYMLAYATKNPDNRYISFKDNRQSRKFLEKLRFNERQFHQFIAKMGRRADKKNEALSFFMRLENQLKITDSRYKSYRRMVLSWGKLKYHAKQLTVTKLSQEIRRLGRGSELITPMTGMIKDRGLRVSSDYKEPRTSLTKKVATAAAGAVAGRYLGKKIAQKTGGNIDKYKKAGTGIGAIAGYWAGGRNKQ